LTQFQEYEIVRLGNQEKDYLMAETLASPADSDVFIPTKLKEPEEVENLDGNVVEESRTDNLATNEELCKIVIDYVGKYYEKFRGDRNSIEDIWRVGDTMLKNAQDEAERETERARLDRQADDATKTKAQKCGSTLYLRQVRSLAAQYVNVLFSQRDPYTYTSRYNPDVPYSGDQAKELATKHNLTMRWNRDQENFTVRSIELLWNLLKYGNQPIMVRWLRKSADVLDKWPTKSGKDTVLERRRVMVENRLDSPQIPIENFWADQNIGDMQQQNCIVINDMIGIGGLLEGVRIGEYTNFDLINESHVYRGGKANGTIRENREKAQGLDSTTGDSQTGQFQRFKVYVLLPIDESKTGKAMWNPMKHEPKKYEVTVISSFSDGICMEIRRNRDPDDEWPVEMVHLMPDDGNKLYHMGLIEALRSNYFESTTAKEQMVDTKTLNNNRPMKVVAGQVRIPPEGLLYKADAVFEVDSQDSLTWAEPMNVPDNQNFLGYIDADSDEAAGNNRATRGEPMGGRTAASEAINAYASAMLPNKMLIKYVFHQWLKFVARKGPRYWHCYALDNQVIKITDVADKSVEIRPSELYGDFDVQINIVDEYENNIVQRQTTNMAIQQLIPLFKDVLDMRKLATLLLEDVLHKDITTAIKPDATAVQTMDAKMENMTLMKGNYVPPMIEDIPEVHIPIHQSFRLGYRGAEKTPGYENIANLDRHIEEHLLLAKNRQNSPAGMAPPAISPNNTTPGMVEGNAIAAQIGSMQNPVPPEEGAPGNMESEGME